MTNKKTTERRVGIDLHFDRKRPEYEECMEILKKVFESLSASGKEELREVGYNPVSTIESASFVIASPKTLKTCTPQDKRLMPTILLLQDDEWNDDTADVLADPQWDVRGLFRLSKLGKNWDYEEFGGLASAIKELARESMRQGGNAEESFRKPVDWKAVDFSGRGDTNADELGEQCCGGGVGGRAPPPTLPGASNDQINTNP